MAMSHPEAVSQLACLSVVPAGDQWAAMRRAAGLSAFHLYLLAQPPDLPERMLAADPELFFGHFLDSWVKVPGAIPEHARRSYVQACSRPETIHAICDDYRAGALIDAEVDVQDHRAGRRVELPVLAAWPDPGDLQLPFDPAQVWRSWAPNLTTAALDCGHFLPEEQPDQVAALVRCLITRS
jgi:pimeloyl-ACP methyl ester carboxylesterase